MGGTYTFFSFHYNKIDDSKRVKWEMKLKNSRQYKILNYIIDYEEILIFKC